MKPEWSIKQSKVSTQARQHTIPASKKAQQMQRTGMRERACGNRTDQSPVAEHAHTHTHKHHHRARTQPGQQTIPASCKNPASRHSRCSAQARASGLARAERAKIHPTGRPPRAAPVLPFVQQVAPGQWSVNRVHHSISGSDSPAA